MEGAKWMEIRNDHTKGLSYTEIGKKYNIDLELSILVQSVNAEKCVR
jgi:hypothetical protein